MSDWEQQPITLMADDSDDCGGPESNGQQPSDAQWPDTLIDKHRKLLMDSGISATTAIARGYETITDPRRLAAIGIPKAGQRTMGMQIPLRTFDGSVWGYTYRPDSPREKNGKICKYEVPYRQYNRLDIPPGVGRMLGDRSIPVWFVEGAKKADCAVQRGLCCVALSGVWGFMHKDPITGNKVPIPELRDIPVNDRKVVIAYDSDAATNKRVWQAMVELGRQLAKRGAKVFFAHLPVGAEKVGLDDYLIGHSVEELMTLVRPNPPLCPDDKPGCSSPPGGCSSPSDSAATPQQSWSGRVPGVAQLRDILAKVGEEVCARGLVGEEKLAKTIYLVLTSRLLDKQVSAAVKGHSSSGKSYTVETVTRFFPTEAFLEFTAMSEKALIYSSEQYTHRTIVIYEVTAMREGVEDDMTSYLIRSLLSEGRIVYDVTVKDPAGGFTTEKITKEGPTNLIFTTTKTRVHAENETRVLSLVTDDSTEQTARVLVEVAKEDNGGNSLDEWVDLQLWLATEHAEHRVTIPYAKELAGLVPPVAVRLRRDFGAVLSLIRAHAMLHQLSRDRDNQDRIIATIEDYQVVRELVADVITEGAERAVSDTVRKTVDAVVELTHGLRQMPTSAQAVATHLNIDKSNAGRRLRMAADGGYIENLEPRRGMTAQWVKGEELPDAKTVLPDAEVLRCCGGVAAGVAPVDLECCGVAPESEGEEHPGADHEHPRADHSTCRYCSSPLLASESRERGFCEGCRLTGKADQR
jgi:hypothetical protein